SKTPVQDLSPLHALENLVMLNIDSTLVRDINALGSLKKLEVLYANYTFISDLSVLRNLPKLERVYCDQTPVTKLVADAFMAAKPEVLVIFDSKDLQAWWNKLPKDW